MPKKYGIKEKDLVVTHVVDLVLTGKLRSGDRLDRNEIAARLGVSRVPVQEAVVQLEHDGILTTRYHRGAFVQRFDEAVVREHQELYGVLCGLASARAAAAADPAVVSELEQQTQAMRTSRDNLEFDPHAREFRTIINTNYAGPRLQATIDSSQTLIPPSFWDSFPGHRDELLTTYEAELSAIRSGRPDAAREACAQRAGMHSQLMVAELLRRGVLSPPAID
ncbi:GntR family transcriptional regulator [Mycobacterium sp. Y57]|uniref:GntR family transcriptional regulator n=1 Tax=Mycolicibacterium xanthum TaxID=2796469 RepID=UPI001C860016|nr:GntR family transcriptional regulator [Mycolicibacterium xanthum]MBX7433710.1 GntR family transcriptional regulator [Mycolicibacterium xanthum]